MAVETIVRSAGDVVINACRAGLILPSDDVTVAVVAPLFTFVTLIDGNL
jgi:hypothetical protein